MPRPSSKSIKRRKGTDYRGGVAGGSTARRARNAPAKSADPKRKMVLDRYKPARSEVAQVFGPATRPSSRGGSHKGVNPLAAPGTWFAGVAGMDKKVPHPGSKKTAASSSQGGNKPTPPKKTGNTAPSPNKQTAAEKKTAKRYEKLRNDAMSTISKKKTKAENKKIKMSRIKLRKVRGKLVAKGYGRFGNKNGRKTGIGILRDLNLGKK